MILAKCREFYSGKHINHCPHYKLLQTHRLATISALVFALYLVFGCILPSRHHYKTFHSSLQICFHFCALLLYLYLLCIWTFWQSIIHNGKIHFRKIFLAVLDEFLWAFLSQMNGNTISSISHLLNATELPLWWKIYYSS